ncbi:peptidylprolyl isomerase [Glaciibacter superstes]|uniref:peptidylprolyl isomerase n=1 Tax=Glaciibacter superstes TaxID=501023 RepID=UPI0003B4160E|nr:peptidylprolyl isomerase [Glaciibacter superstes]
MTTIEVIAPSSERRNRAAVTAFVFGLLAIAGGATFLLGKALPDAMVFAVIQGILIAAPALWLVVVVLAIVLGHIGFARARRLSGSGRGLSITAFVLGYLALVPMATMVWLTVSGLALWGPWFGMLR